MITEVDKYRNWEISFDTYNDTFIAYSSYYDCEQKKSSYAACKKYIDDFIKENEKFTPFYIISIPHWYRRNKEKVKVIGIRKDGRYVVETKKGKGQISEYDEKDYAIYDDAMNDIIKEYERLLDIAEKHREIANNYIKDNFKFQLLSEKPKPELTQTT